MRGAITGISGAVTELVIARPPANALASGHRRELAAAVQAAGEDPRPGWCRCAPRAGGSAPGWA